MENHSVKNLIRLTFACVLLVSMLGGIAIADVIYEPQDNFYTAHSNDCQYVNRDYYSNCKSGYLEIFSKPEGTSLGFADNGEVFHVQFSYKSSNELWGVIDYSESNGMLVPRGENDFNTGWIKLSDVVLKYDYTSFEEKYQSECKSYTGDYLELSGVNNIVTWTFPNSGETSGTLDEVDENFAIDLIYTDFEGLVWADVHYYYGMKNFWICLSEPTENDIAAKDVPSPQIVTPKSGSVPKSAAKDMTLIIVICVATVILFTVVLILILKKRRDKEDLRQK